MRVLRSDAGCAWDRAQDLDSLKSYAIEEVHEVVEAIDSGSTKKHREELGDLLLQVIFQSQIRREEGAFDAHEVCTAITEKMIRRHPHVFGDVVVDGAAQAHASWERIKAAERADAPPTERSILSGVPRSLPGLLRATRLGQKAASRGFDWTEVDDVVGVVRSEVDELADAARNGTAEEIRHEFGDLLFSLANLARHLGVDAEEALRGANGRFTARFARVEDGVRNQGQEMPDVSPQELEALWQQAKRDLAGSD